MNQQKEYLKLLVNTEGQLLAAIHRLNLEKELVNAMYAGTNYPKGNYRFGEKMNGLKTALRKIRSELRALRRNSA